MDNAAAEIARRKAFEICERICDEEGNEWDSDALVTEKNYAHACRDRIRSLLRPAAQEAHIKHLQATLDPSRIQITDDGNVSIGSSAAQEAAREQPAKGGK